MSKYHKQSEGMKALEQSLNNHMEICRFKRNTKRLKAENARLKAEVERLRASSFVTAVPSEDYEKLKAEVERLRKAGDAVALDYAERIEIEAGDTAKNLMRKLPVLREWNAAKEGRPNE